jgi:hypothetical protein
MKDIPCSEHIGEVAVFYLPIKKLSKSIRNKIHKFFVKNYYAYTHEISTIKGFWSKEDKIVKDKHERYEISFKGKDNLKKFIEFLSNICYIIDEDSIYLTIGGESYLIKPRKK